jgi:LysM repeat protein
MIKKTIVPMIFVGALLSCGGEEQETPASEAKSPIEQTLNTVAPDANGAVAMPEDIYTQPTIEEKGDEPAGDHEDDTPYEDASDEGMEVDPSDELAADFSDDSVEHEADAEPASFSEGDYVVIAGDTLIKIARAHNTTVQTIMTANELSDPDKLYVGQKLRIE